MKLYAKWRLTTRTMICYSFLVTGTKQICQTDSINSRNEKKFCLCLTAFFLKGIMEKR